MIGIIDYNAGNLRSICNAISSLGKEYTLIKSPEDDQNITKLILPGVGSFGYLMQQLRETGLDNYIKDKIKDIPYLGICLGYQALFEYSEETPEIKGLSILKGKVIGFIGGKVPQIGWNAIIPTKPSIFHQADMYFANSYYPIPENTDIVATETNYSGKFVSAIQVENITACQFHPEKSGEAGLKILSRWLAC